MTDQQPPQEQPDFQPPPQPGQQYPPPPQPPQPPGQPWIVPPTPPKHGRGSIWLGIGITVASVLAWWGATSAVPYDSPIAAAMNALILVLPFGLVLAGIVLAAIPRTARTGAGILIGIGAGILIAGGLCIALLATFGG
ncbi:MAG: hypothetical protein IT193_14205 [Propionibacteriaceae bacterium]|nr:hypothetical protein [Propionibacteriaceae bacterium]